METWSFYFGDLFLTDIADLQYFIVCQNTVYDIGF